MNTQNLSTLQQAVNRLLKPLIRLLLRHGMPYGVFADLAKQAYVEVAYHDFQLNSRKQSLSRVSIISGINRKDVAKMLKNTDSPSTNEIGLNRNRASRVVNSWLIDPRFVDDQNKPLVLNLGEQTPSFEQLLKAYSIDVPVRAVLDELERLGLVHTTQETVELLDISYVPDHDHQEQLRICGDAAHDLLTTLDHNLSAGSKRKRIQRSVAYDCIDVSALEHIQQFTTEEIQQFVSHYNQRLAQYDLDINPQQTVHRRARAGIGIYYFQDCSPKEDFS